MKKHKCIYVKQQIDNGQARKKLQFIQGKLQNDPLFLDLFDQERNTLAELEKWSTIEEKVLRQKSKMTCISWGFKH